MAQYSQEKYLLNLIPTMSFDLANIDSMLGIMKHRVISYLAPCRANLLLPALQHILVIGFQEQSKNICRIYLENAELKNLLY